MTLTIKAAVVEKLDNSGENGRSLLVAVSSSILVPLCWISVVFIAVCLFFLLILNSRTPKVDIFQILLIL